MSCKRQTDYIVKNQNFAEFNYYFFVSYLK